MAKVSLALGLCLCGLVAAHDQQAAVESQGLPDVINWLKEHGVEAVATAEHCIDAVKAVKQAMNNEQCKFREYHTMAAMAAWAGVEILENLNSSIAHDLSHSPFAQSVKKMAAAEVLRGTHDSYERICTTGCIDNLDALTHFVPCYSSSMCAALNSNLEYEPCKEVMSHFLTVKYAQKKQLMCLKEQSSDYYCSEQMLGFMIQSPVCYQQLMAPMVKPDSSLCDPECVGIWKDFEQKHPYCSRVTSRIQGFDDSIRLVKELLATAKDPKARNATKFLPDHFKSFQEVCKDAPRATTTMMVIAV